MACESSRRSVESRRADVRGIWVASPRKRWSGFVSMRTALWLCLLLFAASGIKAQSTGKISGVILEASTEDPMPGASVYLEENMNLGTLTGNDGSYVILGVPPGTYTVIMSFVGFATIRHEEVQVFSGRTTFVDGTLREQVIEGEEVIVSAERPIVIRDRTSTVSYVDQASIERLPVQELGELVQFQPGVVTSASGGLHFRGGRERETAYIIDGIPVQNVFSQSGGNSVDVEVQSVQELQVFTGTFDAEFGGAQSGIVSVTTRDPARSLEGQLRLQSGDFYANNEDIFLGGTSFEPVATKGAALTLSGPIVGDRIGFFFTGRYEDRSGALQGERRFTAEDGFIIDTYRRWYRDVYQPDDTRLISLDTARTPTGSPVLGADGNPLTFSSGDREIVRMQWRRSITVNPKLVFRPTSRLHVTYSALYNRWQGQGYSNGRRYAPDNRSTSYFNSLAHILSLKQTLGSNKVLALRGSYKTFSSESYAFESMSDPKIQYISASDDATGYSLGSTDNGESRSSEKQIIASGDFTWQINPRNEFKTGFQYRHNAYVIEDLDRSWVHRDNRDSLFLALTYPPALNYPNFADYAEAVRQRLPVLVPELARYAVDDRFEQAPIEFAAFAQNKLEFDRRLVVKLGIRFEYFDVRENRLVDPRTPTDRIGRADNFEPTPSKMYFSPRVGISYPISERGAFRVAYGHFVQMPAYREMFKNPVFSTINVGRLEGRSVGNPDLEPERTIKYEMGLQQQLSSSIGLDINLFYKNIRNLLGTEILGTLDNVQYTRTVNRDYGLVRGGTISLVTRPEGLLLNAALDLTYSDARGSSSSPGDVANIVIAGRSGEVGDLFLERQIIPLNWDQTLTLNASANIGRANNWSVGFISQLATGQPYTPAFLDPNLDFPDNEFDNALKKPTLFTFDLTAEKRIKAGRLTYGIRIQVENVFNYLNELYVDSVSGRTGQIIRLPVVQQDRDMVNNFVGLFTTHEADNIPNWYSAPRKILFAVTIGF